MPFTLYFYYFYPSFIFDKILLYLLLSQFLKNRTKVFRTSTYKYIKTKGLIFNLLQIIKKFYQVFRIQIKSVQDHFGFQPNVTCIIVSFIFSFSRKNEPKKAAAVIRFASTCYTSVKHLKHSLVPRSVICLPFGPPSFLKLLTATYQGGKQHVRGEVNLLPQVYEHYLCTDSSKGLV